MSYDNRKYTCSQPPNYGVCEHLVVMVQYIQVEDKLSTRTKHNTFSTQGGSVPGTSLATCCVTTAIVDCLPSSNSFSTAAMVADEQ